MSKTPFELLLDSADWRDLSPVGTFRQEGMDEIPTATHEGLLTIGNTTMRVYRLSDGRAIIAAEDLIAFFGGAIPMDEIEK